MIRTALPATAALLLAACSSGSEPAATETSDAAKVDPELTAAASATPSPTTMPEATQSPVADAIPAAAQGRWGLVPADCTSTRGDAKGLLIVEPKRIKFYESVAKLGAISESSASRLRAAFAFSGEGMEWKQDMTLDVQDGGKTLIRREYGDEAAPGPFKYTRC
jgi:hypothetical protein